LAKLNIPPRIFAFLLEPPGLPRDLMRKIKMAAAHEGKTVKGFLMELAPARIDELERKGILPKSK